MSRRIPMLLVTVLGAVATCVVVTSAPAAADQAVTLGRTAHSANASSCNGSPDFEAFQFASAGGIPVAAPFAGVLTSWSFEAQAQTTTLTLRVFRLVGSGTYKPVAEGGPLQTIAPGTGLRTFPVRVAVQKGDFIGLRSTAGACISSSPEVQDFLKSSAGTATALGTSKVYATSPGVVLDIAASLEPDADGDGFGDVTQDQCATLASSQGRCDTTAPNTTVTKKPKRGSGVSSLSFTSSEAGSTFTCSMDGKKEKPCTSPAAYVCLKPGKHTFTVQATDPAGNVDATPARKRFRLALHRRGC